MKTSRGFWQQYDMHGIDLKKFISNSIDQWQMRLEKVVKEDRGHIVYLI